MFGAHYKFGSKLCEEDPENSLDIASVSGVNIDLQRMEMEVGIQVIVARGRIVSLNVTVMLNTGL